MISPISRPTRRHLQTAAASLLLLAGLPAVSAAPIAWSSPQPITSSAEVATAGATVLAVHAKYNGIAETVNGVTFHPTPQTSGLATPYTVGAVTFTAVNDTSANGASLNGTAPFLGSKQLSGADADAYERTLSNAFEVNGAAGGTVTLSGLTIGQEYLVQFWAADFRHYTNDRGITISGSNELEFLGGNGSGTSSGRGHSITGTFTADAATQVFSMDLAGADNVVQFNAFQLRNLDLLAAPVFTPPAGTYPGAQTVTITAAAGTTVHYTTDGSVPDHGSPSGVPGSGSATVSVPADLTLKAIAAKSGKADSPVASAAYVITLASPAFDPPPGAFRGTQAVTLTAGAGTTVFYTTDGSLPGPTSPHGVTGSGSATVTVTAPGSLLISAKATKPGVADSPLATGYYRAVSAAAEIPVFTGPRREGVNQDGVIKMRWGIEQVMLFEDGIFKSWYHSAPDSGGDYWNNPVIRYATSPDGITWTDQGTCLGNSPYHRACHFVYHIQSPTAAGEPAGYYMPVGRNGQFGFDLFYSTTGLPGSWVWQNNQNLILPMGSSGQWDRFRTGNICIWYEHGRWEVLYEACAAGGEWQVGRAYGAALTSLAKHPGNPVIPYPRPVTHIGGPEMVKVGDTYYCILHETDPSINSTPGSCVLYKSTDLNNWTRMGWISREWVYKNNQAQVADASVISRNGKTWMWYEDVQYQNPQLPELSLMTWDMPFEELVHRPEMWDDVEAEGWAYEAGYGEVLSAPGVWPSTYIRKIGAPIPPNCMVLTTDASHGLRLRKPIGLTNPRYSFSARASQTTVKFTPLRLDADAANTALAGAFFDADGKLKYHNGAAITTIRPYAANTTYTFSYDCAPSSYTLSINGKVIASNIPYAAAGTPAYFKIEQEPGGTSYAGTPQPVAAAQWSGAANDIWDTSTANWIAAGPPANQYAGGDTVRFDDTAAGTGAASVMIMPSGVTPGGITVDNATRNYSIDGGAIGGSGSLTKTGAANLELAGDNSFSGATDIAAGSLALSGSLAGGTSVSVAAGASFTLTTHGALTFKPAANGVVNTLGGTGTAVFHGRFEIDLTAAASAAGNSWLLVNAPALAETYGASFQVSGFRETEAGSGVWSAFRGAHQWTFDESSGLLSVQPATYSTWIDSYFPGAADPAVTGPDADPDGDGLDNGIEFLVGSMPHDNSSKDTPLVTGTGHLVVTFLRVDAAEAYEVAVESSSTLEAASWTSIVVPNGAVSGPPVTVVDNGSEPDDITVVVPANDESRGFARVRITIPPSP